MLQEESPDQSVQQVLNAQREESEAREILKDIGNLYGLPPEKKGRWIWELLQNARDCAKTIGEKKEVNVTVTLDQNSLIFQHDGKVFSIGDLIALLRRTSNKPNHGENGNTGKYGTGFVTTHVLSKIAHVDSYVQGKKGLKHFRLTMNRSFEEITELQAELIKVFNQVDELSKSTNYVAVESAITKFEYPLNENSIEVAKATLTELLENIHFTLLCNREIASVTVVDKLNNKNYVFKIESEETISENCKYYPINAKEGIIYFKKNAIELGLPVSKRQKQFSVKEIGKQARLYKELPMIGTEDYNLPFLIQSSQFNPPEPRDGLRTTKEEEEKADTVADSNRLVLSKLPNAIQTFYTELLNLQVENLHLLVETGLPNDPFHYTDYAWHQKNIQVPLRNFFNDYPLVITASGKPRKISDCRFIDFPFETWFAEFHKIVAELHPEITPSENSFRSWDKIIHQSQHLWPEGILYSLDNLINDISELRSISNFPFQDEKSTLVWLNEFYQLLKNTNQTGISDAKAIFPSQNGTLELRQKLNLDSLNNELFKTACEKLNFPVAGKLVHASIEQKNEFVPLNTEEFLSNFHSQLSKLDIRKFDTEKIQPILQIVSLFRTRNSPVRITLYELVKSIIPIPEIVDVNDMEYYDWNTPDSIVAKYLCTLIENSSNITTFSLDYFENNIADCIDWLNKFYKFLSGNDDNRKLRENFKIILVQSGNFSSYSNQIYYEDSLEPFDVLIKELYRDYTKLTNPYDFLVDRRIEKEHFNLISIDFLTQQIDSLFKAPDAENKVKAGHTYNTLFHKLNKYVNEIGDSKSRILFPIFLGDQANLLVKAFGTEISNKVLIIQKMDRSEEELHVLAKLKLPAEKLLELETAAGLVGHENLMEQARIMNLSKEQAKWRKNVGTLAEDAFRKAITGIETELEIDNPDSGMDFTLKLKNKNIDEYSVEIKSTGIGVPSISMSQLQGLTAWERPKRYALCVIRRDENNDVQLEHFKANALFKVDIGSLIGEKMKTITSGLLSLSEIESGDITVNLENKKYSVSVMESVWMQGIPFKDFVELLKDYFGLREQQTTSV